jgi:hypothetical protein
MRFRAMLPSLYFAIAKRTSAFKKLTALVTHPSVPIVADMQLMPPPNRFLRPTHMNLGKCEPQEIGLLILYLSGQPDQHANPTDVWHTVPWPKLAWVFNRKLGNLLWSLCWDVNPLSLGRNIIALNHVPPMPEDDVSNSIGPLGGPMFETTRSNGVPNSLVIGARWLIEQGYVELIVRDDGPDLLIPKQKLVDAAQRSIQRAA